MYIDALKAIAYGLCQICRIACVWPMKNVGIVVHVFYSIQDAVTDFAFVPMSEVQVTSIHYTAHTSN